MTTRYELSHTGDGEFRLRFIDVETTTYQDYMFARKEFEEFSDALMFTLVETQGLTDHG